MIEALPSPAAAAETVRPVLVALGQSANAPGSGLMATHTALLQDLSTRVGELCSKADG